MRSPEILLVSITTTAGSAIATRELSTRCFRPVALLHLRDFLTSPLPSLRSVRDALSMGHGCSCLLGSRCLVHASVAANTHAHAQDDVTVEWAPPASENWRRRAPIYLNPENPGLSELEIHGRVQDDEGVEVDAARGVEARSGRQGGRRGGDLPGGNKAGGASHQGRHRQHGQPCTGATWFLIGGAQPRCRHLSDVDLVHHSVLSLPSETFLAPRQGKHSALARSSSAVNMLLDMATSAAAGGHGRCTGAAGGGRARAKGGPRWQVPVCHKGAHFPASPCARLAVACHRLHAAHQSMISPLHVLLHDGTRLTFSSCKRRQHTLADILPASTEPVLK